MSRFHISPPTHWRRQLIHHPFLIPLLNTASVRAAHSFITRDEQLAARAILPTLACLQAFFPDACLTRIKTASTKQLAAAKVEEGETREEKRVSRSFFMVRMQKFQPQEARREARTLLPSPFTATPLRVDTYMMSALGGGGGGPRKQTKEAKSADLSSCQRSTNEENLRPLYVHRPQDRLLCHSPALVDGTWDVRQG